MARIRVARGSRTNLPGALDENALLYGELFWEREQPETSDGILYMGKPDGVSDGENDKAPLPIAGARAMRSLYFQGVWDPSTGQYPTNAQVGDIYVAEADGTGSASTFKYGDWAVCIGKDDGTSQWLKAINQAITTEDPLGHDRNPLQLNEGVLRLKYDPATLRLNENGELTVSHTEVYTTESTVHIDEGEPVALNEQGKAIVADCTDVDTAIVIGLAASTAEPGDLVTVQRADIVELPTASFPAFIAIGGPVYLYVDGTLTQDVEQIQPGFVLQQVGIAVDEHTIDVHIGTPFQIDVSSDMYYIPLTQTITPGDKVHAPSSAAVHQIVQQLTNLDAEVVTKTDEGTQPIAGSLHLQGDLTARDIFVSSDSVHIGDARLSSADGVLQFTNLSDANPTASTVTTVASLQSHPGNIVPDLTETRTVGSSTHNFGTVYTKELNVDGSVLSIDTSSGRKILLDGNEIITTGNQGGIVQDLTPDSGEISLGTSSDPFQEAHIADELHIGSATLSSDAVGSLQIDNAKVITDLDLLNLTQDIIPATTDTYNLGSSSRRFNAVYAEEVYVGANSLYVNDKKVIEDKSNQMEFKTSIDQALAVKTEASTPGSGIASLTIEAGNKLEFFGYGGVDLTVPSNANGKNIVLSTQSSGGTIQLYGNTTMMNNLSIEGNLTVQGQTTQLDVEQVNIKDNLIRINSNQTGTPASSLIGGVEVNRGDEQNYRFVFQESTQTFRVGKQGALQPVATRKDDMGVNSNVPVWDTTLNQFQNTSVTISGSTITGTLDGNAATATKLQTARTITLAGDVTGSVSFDGTSSPTLTATVANNSHTHTSANITDATAAATANKIVLRDGSGNFSANTITAALDGNAATATRLQTTRTFTLSGDVSGSATFNGTENANISTTVANNSHTHVSANITDATHNSTASTIVRRDSNGNFSAGTITAALNGNAASSTTTNQVRGVNFYTGTTNPSATTRLNMDGDFYATHVFNAVFNDIADFIQVPNETIVEYGKAYVMDAEENYGASQGYLPEGILGIVSDTYGIGVGQKQSGKQLPIAIGGFVLAHIDQQYPPGTPLTAGPKGTLTEIKLEDKRNYPERIVATYWKPEPEAHWNGVLVNGRHWVKVK